MEVPGRRPVGNDGHNSGLFCDPCKEKNEDEPAMSYCTVCIEYLCRGCTKAHTRAKATRNHRLLDQDSMPKQKPSSDKDSMCPKHSDKPIEFYCNFDGQFCCSVCAAFDHKRCSTQYINDIATNFQQSNEYVAFEKASADLIRLLQETKERATSNIKDIATIQANFISDVQHFRTEINNKLDSLEKSAMKDVQIVKDGVPAQTSDQSTVSYVGNIDIQHSTDKKRCLITGGVLIDQTKLALVDYWNFCVKVADVDTNTRLSCIKLTKQPWDITCVNRDQIVVTCNAGNKGKLVFLKVGISLSVLKMLNVGQYCRGIVYSNNTLIVSFGHSESSVKIFDMNGKVLKTLKMKAGDVMCPNPGYISLTTDQQTVFVSDVSNNSVTSLTLDGTVQHVYTADSLDNPRGLAVDRNDNVYIAGWMSNNIHQLSTDGNRSQVILDGTHGVKGPSMVTYCKTRHRLYISVEKEGCDVVSVYHLHTDYISVV